MANFHMISCIPVLLIVVGLSGSDAADPAIPPKCPDGFTGHLNSCYKVLKLSATWAQARVYCSSLEARLVRIESKEIDTFLTAEIKSLVPDFANKLFWLDGTDLQEEGIWRWTSADKVMTYTNWLSGEPNNALNSKGDTEECLVQHGNHDLKWGDQNCGKTAHITCEISLIEDFQNGIIG